MSRRPLLWTKHVDHGPKSYRGSTKLSPPLIPKEPRDPRDHNLKFDRLYKLEKWSNGAKILVCGGRPSYLLNKTILTQKKFMVSEF